MESTEIKNIEDLRKLSTLYFTSLKPVNDKTKVDVAQIKFANYFELGCTITDMLKLCILALDQDAHKISKQPKDKSINVALILEMVLEMFPLDEFEFLSEISQMVAVDSSNICG